MKDVTTVATTVPEVLKERIGVCQDFAHVLIGLCRAVDIPARYVSGYIVATSLEVPIKRPAGAPGRLTPGLKRTRRHTAGGDSTPPTIWWPARCTSRWPSVVTMPTCRPAGEPSGVRRTSVSRSTSSHVRSIDPPSRRPPPGPPACRWCPGVPDGTGLDGYIGATVVAGARSMGYFGSASPGAAQTETGGAR